MNSEQDFLIDPIKLVRELSGLPHRGTTTAEERKAADILQGHLERLWRAPIPGWDVTAVLTGKEYHYRLDKLRPFGVYFKLGYILYPPQAGYIVPAQRAAFQLKNSGLEHAKWISLIVYSAVALRRL